MSPHGKRRKDQVKFWNYPINFCFSVIRSGDYRQSAPPPPSENKILCRESTRKIGSAVWQTPVFGSLHRIRAKLRLRMTRLRLMKHPILVSLKPAAARQSQQDRLQKAVSRRPSLSTSTSRSRLLKTQSLPNDSGAIAELSGFASPAAAEGYLCCSTVTPLQFSPGGSALSSASRPS